MSGPFCGMPAMLVRMAALNRAATAGSPPVSCGVVSTRPGSLAGVVIAVIVYPWAAPASGAAGTGLRKGL
ncbi:hypothetical protein GCM10009648_09160 [Tsukamurella spumae]